MKLKTATLLGAIGTGLAFLLQLYYFIWYNIIERDTYNSIIGDISSITSLLFYSFLFIFLIVFYQKQNNKSWKD